MSIPEEAVEAAAKELWLGGTTEPHRLRKLRAAIEAAAPYVVKDMRPLTLVEKAARDRPDSMAAARQQVRAERASAMSERLRAEREKAWKEGFESGAAWDQETSYPPANPHEASHG